MAAFEDLEVPDSLRTSPPSPSLLLDIEAAMLGEGLLEMQG